MTTTPTVAVLGFHSDAAEEAALRATFERLEYPAKKLVVRPAERERELHSLSFETDDVLIAGIHPAYGYPADYLQSLVRSCTDPAADALWTADRSTTSGALGHATNPDLYQSLVPAHVLRLLFSRHDRRIPSDKRNERARAVQSQITDTTRVQTNDALPYRVHAPNGLYWMVDYAHRMDRRCILAYTDFKKIPRESLALDGEAFVESLTSLQLRHLRFFLNTNVAGQRAIEYVAQHIDLSTVKTGLDVGSGYGGLVKAMIDGGCEATGLEIMKPLTDLAKINLAQHAAKHIVDDFLKADLAPESFDLVTMTDVIEHVASAEQAMERTAKVLRPGGYAYIKIPNYRFIDHVREDAHTGLFGITLLRHDPAAAYLSAVKNSKYSVGDYHDYDYYIRTFAKYGVSLVRADNVQPPMSELPKLRAACLNAFTQWESEAQLDSEIKANVRRHVSDYLREFDQRSKPRKKFLFFNEPDPLFVRDYMTATWNMFFQKRR